jgi:hypothetical protein
VTNGAGNTGYPQVEDYMKLHASDPLQKSIPNGSKSLMYDLKV